MYTNENFGIALIWKLIKVYKHINLSYLTYYRARSIAKYRGNTTVLTEGPTPFCFSTFPISIWSSGSCFYTSRYNMDLGSATDKQCHLAEWDAHIEHERWNISFFVISHSLSRPWVPLQLKVSSNLAHPPGPIVRYRTSGKALASHSGDRLW